MAITYNAGTNTITVTGYTEGTPCNFTDIYNADVAGGWGVVTRQCTNQFCFDCGLIIGDGSTTTWFADTNKQVKFNVRIFHSPVYYSIRVRINANFRSGVLINDADKRTKEGCSFVFDCGNFSTILGEYPTTSPTGVIELYSTNWAGIGYRAVVMGFYNSKIYNSLGSSYAEINRSFNSNLYNITLQKGWAGLVLTTGTISNIYINDADYVFHVSYLAPTAPVFKNVIARGCTAFCDVNTLNTFHVYFINVDSDVWTFNYLNVCTYNLYRQHEFDLKVVDKDGVNINAATAKIWDKDDSLVTNTTTNASGVLATQTLNYGYYNKAGGDTPVMKTPHEIRIYKYGKSMMSSKSSIEKVTDWALTMLTDDHITQTTEATVAAYTGIAINHTTETITISENHTLDEIYDYCQYDIIAATKQLDQTMHTSDGVNFVSEYSFAVVSGITVTATDQKLSMVSGETYTLIGSAQFTGIIATTSTTINKQISLGTDDCEEHDDTSASLTQTISHFGNDGTSDDLGLRWQSVDIPQAATITSAKLSLYLYWDDGTLSANIRGIDEDNTVTWATDDRPSQRLKTTATITANEANWNNWATDSWIDIDITSVIQEIIDRGGWSANNALAIVIENTSGSSGNYSQCRMYEYAGNLHGAKLDIVYGETTTRIPVKLTNIIDGSRYWVGKQSDGTKIFEGTQSGSGTVTGYYEHTANTDIDIRTRKSSASVKYKPWIGEGTLIAETFSLRIRQIQDSIVT